MRRFYPGLTVAVWPLAGIWFDFPIESICTMKNQLFLLLLTIGISTLGWSQTSVAFAVQKQPMTMQKFNSLVRVMKDQQTESARSAVLRETFEVNTNYFTIFQLNTLLILITSESERLDFAKKAIMHTLNEANVEALSEVFTRQGNRDELMNYIATTKPRTWRGRQTTSNKQ